jgi:predicted transposase YdaD
MGKQQAKIEAITGLREMGLSDEQIAKCLDMTLEAVQNMLYS